MVGEVSLFDSFEPEGIPSHGDLHGAYGLARLLALPGIGPKRALKLADRFLNWEHLSEASAEELTSVTKAKDGGLKEAVSRSAPIEQSADDSRAIGCFDDEWPKWLNDINDAPVVIYVRGSMPPGGSLGVVGTRQPTKYGLSVVDAIVKEAAAQEVGIVSGLAFGIDAEAHQAALRYGTLTWAILGSGVDVPTPREHIHLAEEILEAGGGLLSEQCPGTQPMPRTLVARNRLQSAASSALVAAQCGIPSGTLHTVRFALQQGRRLVVPRPRSPWDQEKESAGNLALTDPAGCPPAVIGATGGLIRSMASRLPLADVVLNGVDDIPRIWE
jgi:DNA processing protein